MLIGDRLRTIREAKKLSQGEIEQRSGLSLVANDGNLTENTSGHGTRGGVHAGHALPWPCLAQE